MPPRFFAYRQSIGNTENSPLCYRQHREPSPVLHVIGNTENRHLCYFFIDIYTDTLLRFAYYYLRINEPDALEPVQDGTSRVLLRVEDADRVLYRFFGKTVEHTEDYYYFPMTEGELYPSFSIVGGISENSDGTYRIGFTRWGLYSEERQYDTVPDECYYLSCETQDAYVCYAGGGSAVSIGFNAVPGSPTKRTDARDRGTDCR